MKTKVSNLLRRVSFFALFTIFTAQPSLAQAPSGAPEKSTEAIRAEHIRKGWSLEPVKPVAPREMTAEERSVLARANERWVAIEKGDIEAAYAFLSPGSRSFKSLAQFTSELRASTIKRAKAESVQCSAEGRCNVLLAGSAQTPVGKAGNVDVSFPLQETWLKGQDGSFGLLYQ